MYGYSSTEDIIELELDEEGTRISLTIVDTPGFGDQIDNEARSVFESVAILDDVLRLHSASLRSWAISNINTMIFWQRNRASSVIPDSGTIVFMPCFTSSRRRVMGQLLMSNGLLPTDALLQASRARH
jgi:hypothetical protein